MISNKTISEDDLQEIYRWIDDVPLSRPKRNIARDFSDGVMLAETIHHFIPRIVELHNYSSANGIKQKKYNWTTLRNKVFPRLNIQLEENDVDQIVKSSPGYIEYVLKQVKSSIEDKLLRRSLSSSQSMVRNPSRILKSAPTSSHSSSHSSSNRVFQPHPQPHPKQKDKNKSLQRNVNDNDNAVNVIASSLPEMEELLFIIEKKDQTIQELNSHIDSLESRIVKLEQVIRLKDAKIQKLQKPTASSSFRLRS